jgi:hypothetical protein
MNRRETVLALFAREIAIPKTVLLRVHRVIE